MTGVGLDQTTAQDLARSAAGGRGACPCPTRSRSSASTTQTPAPLLDPPLTVLARRDHEIGDLAVSMVLRALEHMAAGSIDVRISMELAVRRSCGCRQGQARAVAGVLTVTG